MRRSACGGRVITFETNGLVLPTSLSVSFTSRRSGVRRSTVAPSCAEAGVLGVLPGIIGSIQAIETIKLLLGLVDPLVGRLLAYGSLEQSFREFKVRKDPANEITWENRDRITVAELDELCMPHPLQVPAR